MEVVDAIIATAKELGWSSAMLAATAGRTERAAQKWLARKSIPGGDVVVRLLRDMPQLRERLGFSLMEAA